MSATDKIKNKTQSIGGEIKDKVGGATGDSSLQAEGKKDKVAGNLKDAGEKVKDAFR